MTIESPIVNETPGISGLPAFSETRCLEAAELYKCKECFYGFFKESQLPGSPNWQHWQKLWVEMIEGHIGYLLATFRDDRIIGVLGGLCYPCMLTGELEMVEAFWWVQPQYRGGTTGIRLFQAFEKLSKDLGAKRIKMVHLSHINLDTMKDIYIRMGYRPIEVGYLKEIG